jgi:hypothetical protein
MALTLIAKAFELIFIDLALNNLRSGEICRAAEVEIVFKLLLKFTILFSE